MFSNTNNEETVKYINVYNIKRYSIINNPVTNLSSTTLQSSYKHIYCTPISTTTCIVEVSVSKRVVCLLYHVAQIRHETQTYHPSHTYKIHIYLYYIRTCKVAYKPFSTRWSMKDEQSLCSIGFMESPV